MKHKVIKINESMLENLVKKILQEEENNNEPVKEKKSTLTRHPAYPIIDKLERQLDDLKSEFKSQIANQVSGEDGYHSEIDKFNSDFNKFIGKVSDLKGKINDYTITTSEATRKKRELEKMKMKEMEQMKKNKAFEEGKKYYY